jgi:hypothetical protein
MKKLLIVIGFLFIASLARSEVYVCFDKETGDAVGMVDIKPDTVGDWAKTYVMKEADESYRGKQGHEMKFENKKLRLATEKEIADHKKEIDDKAKINSRKNALEAIGITEADIAKLKGM